jgi:hypothetical protein
MKTFPLLFCALALTASCGTETASELTLEEIRLRLEGNRCRLVLDKAQYEIMSWEYDHEDRITSGEMLRAALPDSLVVCPVTLEPYVLELDSDSRHLVCPAGHGSIELMEE